MATKLNLKTTPYPKPYTIWWLQNGSTININKACLVSFSIGKNYKDEVLCEVVPMDACHILLGRPWAYDRRIKHDGFHNTYSFYQ